MADLTIHITDELLERLRKLSPVTLDEFCQAALEAALRESDMTKPISAAPAKQGAGRPPKRAGRKKVTFQVETDLLACLDNMTAGMKNARSDVLNKVLQFALDRGFLVRP